MLKMIPVSFLANKVSIKNNFLAMLFVVALMNFSFVHAAKPVPAPPEMSGQESAEQP